MLFYIETESNSKISCTVQNLFMNYDTYISSKEYLS